MFGSCDDVSLCASYSPTSHVFDIDDEFRHHDSNEDSSDFDLSSTYHKVSLTSRDVEIVDLSTGDRPRELNFGLALSVNEIDRLIQLLKSYLDFFAWSYEDMLGLDSSIIQHRLPLLPYARLIKQKLRQLNP